MPTCEHCSASNVRWFTPTRYGQRAAVLLCMSCQRLTIVPPRVSRVLSATGPTRRLTRGQAQRAA